MKIISASFAVLSLTSITIAQANWEDWHPPSSGDVRGPCPALNSLANHGILPRNGKNLTIPIVVTALASVNVSTEIAGGLAKAALGTSDDPASGAFDLDDLKKHNILEHDGSLSRKDTNMPGGPEQNFDCEIFDEFVSYFNGSEHITIPLAAAGRWGRIQTERQRDPKFSYSPTNRFNSYAESAVYFGALQDAKTATVPLEFIKVLFTEERFPYKEGWRPVNNINGFSMAQIILQLSLSTPEDAGDVVVPDVQSHAGIF